MTKEDLSATADSLLQNEALRAALVVMRAESLEELLRASATDADAIRAHQADVKAIDSFVHRLRLFIEMGKPRKAPGIV
jgi:predicted nucleic-acid-binding protein